MQQIANYDRRDLPGAPRILLAMTSLILIVGWFFASTVNAGATTTDKGDEPYVYIFGDQGEFSKVDLEDLQVTAKWNLAQIEGLSGVVARYVPVTAAHAFGLWRPGAIFYDRKTQRLFATLPGEVNDDGSSSKYSVVVLRVPDFELVGKISFLDQVQSLPSVVLTPDGRTLFANYVLQQGADKISLLEVYDTNTLKKVFGTREAIPVSKLISGSCFNKSTGSCFNNTLGANAYALADQKTIFDWNYMLSKLTFNGDKVTRESLGTKYASPVVGGKSLIIEKDATSNERFASAFDFGTDTLIGSRIHVPPVGNLYLSADGRKLVFEAFRTENGIGYLTGHFVVYNVADGAETRTLEIPALQGEVKTHRMICMSPDGEHMIYQTGRASIFDVHLGGAYEARLISVRLNVGDLPRCVFTSEPAKSTN